MVLTHSFFNFYGFSSTIFIYVSKMHANILYSVILILHIAIGKNSNKPLDNNSKVEIIRCIQFI